MEKVNLDNNLINNAMENFQKAFDELKDQVGQIYDALVGNELSQDGGLVDQVKTLKKEVEILRKFRDKAAWTMCLILGFSPVLGFFLTMVFNYFLKTKN